MTQKRVIFLMSDTGGGHRAAANAIRTALDQRYPGEYTFELVDVYRRYTPFPFTTLPELYPRWIRWAAPVWAHGYRLTNAPGRANAVMTLLSKLWLREMKRMIAEHPADVYVSVHAVFSRPVLSALVQSSVCRPRFVTVVTDLVSAHVFWYEYGVDRCLVPTQAVYDQALAFGLQPHQLRVTGLPIDPRFVRGLPDQAEARRRLRLDPTLPAVLLIGGGDGMGPVYRIASELNRRVLPMQLIVVTGRNRLLLRRLEAVSWNHPALLFPFVNNMPELMAAADILVTKAGPATICEACIAGLPIVLSSAVPGQEDGNVTYVVENGAGDYAPGAVRAADTVAAWLAAGPDALARRAACATRLGRPEAVWTIADEIHTQAQVVESCPSEVDRRQNRVDAERHIPGDRSVL